MPLNLLSNTARVETPFITVTIAGQKFGLYSRDVKSVVDESGFTRQVSMKYPNFMKSLTATKINGQVNTYTIVMEYNIRSGDDPNFLDKLFSRASKDRKIKLSYGDMSTPSFTYKEEEAVITDVKSAFDLAGGRIVYTVSCTSEALSLTAGTYFFPERFESPSVVLKEILYDKRYGMLDVFSGMRDKSLVEMRGLIATDDKKVQILSKSGITVLDYVSYLVSCMTSDSTTNSNSLTQGNKYILTVVDDVTGEFGGAYFKVQKVARNIQDVNSLDIYSIDIGYPSVNNVIGFTIDDNQAYSILYDYSQQIQQPDYNYRINNQGEIEYIYAPVLGRQSSFYRTTEVDKTWWTKVTQYPINATITIKGLLRPAILMTYLKVNTLFFGRKHLSSGTYIITKQVDTVDASGYKTTLSLLRIEGDEL